MVDGAVMVYHASATTQETVVRFALAGETIADAARDMGIFVPDARAGKVTVLPVTAALPSVGN